MYCIKYFRLLSSEVNRFQYQHFCLGLHFKEKIKWPQILVIALSPIIDIVIENLCAMEYCVATENNPFEGSITLLLVVNKLEYFRFLLDII